MIFVKIIRRQQIEFVISVVNTFSESSTMSRQSYLSKSVKPIPQILLLVVLSGGIFYSGCSDQKQGPAKPTTPTTSGSSSDPTKIDSNKANSDEVVLQVKSYDEIVKTIAAQKGKVVVMDCWATFCGPCKKEFPHLIELSNKYSQDKVQCVSLSFDNNGVDPIEKNLPKIKEFLVEQKASKLLNFVTEDESDLLYDKERLDFVAIPAVFVYDKQGKLIKRFDNSVKDAKPFTYADVEKLVEELTASKE
jgi:thiol-disulfide isomerase/thioredoxin